MKADDVILNDINKYGYNINEFLKEKDFADYYCKVIDRRPDVIFSKARVNPFNVVDRYYSGKDPKKIRTKTKILRVNTLTPDIDIFYISGKKEKPILNGIEIKYFKKRGKSNRPSRSFHHGLGELFGLSTIGLDFVWLYSIFDSRIEYEVIQPFFSTLQTLRLVDTIPLKFGILIKYIDAVFFLEKDMKKIENKIKELTFEEQNDIMNKFVPGYGPDNSDLEGEWGYLFIRNLLTDEKVKDEFEYEFLPREKCGFNIVKDNGTKEHINFLRSDEIREALINTFLKK